MRTSATAGNSPAQDEEPKPVAVPLAAVPFAAVPLENMPSPEMSTAYSFHSFHHCSWVTLLTAAVLLVPIPFSSVLVHAQFSLIRVPADVPTIQGAILAAFDGDVIEVAPGVYPESLDFLGKVITVRSTGGPTVTTVQGNGASAVVRFVAAEGLDSILDGFEITGGSAWEGGGIYCLNSSPTILRCHVTGNVAANGPCCLNHGGGIAVVARGGASAPWIENCTVFLNNATSGGGLACIAEQGGQCSPTILRSVIHHNSALEGGGLFTWANSLEGGGIVTPLVQENLFHDNQAANVGGGIAAWESRPFITHNILRDNQGGLGGGIGALEARPNVLNNLLHHNTATTAGGGLFLEFSGFAIANNTIVHNTTQGAGGGMFTNLNVLLNPSVFTNNIVWANLAAQSPGIHDVGLVPSVLYSVVTGGHAGFAVLDVDPQFMDAAAADYRLIVQSAAVDAGLTAPGLPLTDLAGQPRIFGASVDMGAYERQGVRFVRGDLNLSGTANLADAVLLLGALFVSGATPLACLGAADCNDDAMVNLLDPVFLLNAIFVPGSPGLPPPNQCEPDPTLDTLPCSGPDHCP